jgi:hypothetical protein
MDDTYRMKKVIALGLFCFICGTAFLFADDAGVLPARTGRFYLTPTFAFANGFYDTDGAWQSYESGQGALQGFLLGAALEYGIFDWLSAAVQWTPGWMAASHVDGAVINSDNVNANGVTDLFIGGKFQLIGEKAPVQSSLFRFSLAAGVKTPLPGPDFEQQYENALKPGNQPVTGANQDRHVTGFGVRSYFDWVISKNFYIDLYGEFISYPMRGKLTESGLEGYALVKSIDGVKDQLSLSPDPADQALAAQLTYKNEVDYGFDLTLELEPVFSSPLSEGVTFTAGLPLNYQFTPGKKYDITVPDLLIDRDPSAAALRLADEDPGHILSLKPGIAFFFTGFLFPTELKLNYSAPVAGSSNIAVHSLTLQIKIYFKL